MTQADSGNSSLGMSLDPVIPGHVCYRCDRTDSLRPVGAIEQGTGAGWVTYACEVCRASDLVSADPRTLDLAQLQRVRDGHASECDACRPRLGVYCRLGQRLVNTIAAMVAG